MPKTAFAGVMLETSFARLRASMAIFSAERTPSRPFGRREPGAMVGMQGHGEEAVRREGCEEESEL